VTSVSVCLCVCVCLSAIISPELHDRSSPNFVHVTYGRGSVLLSKGVVICYVLPVLLMTSYLHISQLAARRRHQAEAARLTRTSYAALSLARRNTCCRQRTLGTTSCSQGILGRSGRVEYTATRKRRVLKVTRHVATLGAESDCLVCLARQSDEARGRARAEQAGSAKQRHIV